MLPSANFIRCEICDLHERDSTRHDEWQHFIRGDNARNVKIIWRSDIAVLYSPTDILERDRSAFIREAEEYITSFCKEYGGNLSAQNQRSLKYFGMLCLAGKLAANCGTLEFGDDEIKNSIRSCVTAWLNAKPSQQLPDEIARAVITLKRFCQEHQSRFSISSDPTNKAQVHNCVGIIKKHNGEISLFCFYTESFEAVVLKGFLALAARKYLKSKGLLETDSDNRTAKTIKGTKYVAVKSEILNIDFGVDV